MKTAPATILSQTGAALFSATRACDIFNVLVPESALKIAGAGVPMIAHSLALGRSQAGSALLNRFGDAQTVPVDHHGRQDIALARNHLGGHSL